MRWVRQVHCQQTFELVQGSAGPTTPSPDPSRQRSISTAGAPSKQNTHHNNGPRTPYNEPNCHACHAACQYLGSTCSASVPTESTPSESAFCTQGLATAVVQS
mmetsp:Transcript_76408/g.134923  ORF Transcript_76408/g.134923 Transcript_76408/m.134923 type:complete len:103 (+) Transcript_76408:253-561(+)